MAAIWMWVRSDQRRHWASLLGLAAVVALGVGPALALAGGAHRADTVYERFASRTGTATITMIPSTDGPLDLASINQHLAILEDVRAIAGVESVHVGTQSAARPILNPENGSANAKGGLVEAFSQGLTDIDPAHQPFLVVSGTPPTPDDPQGIVINEAAARQAGLGIGSTVDFETAGPARLAEWWEVDRRVSILDGPRVHTVVRAIVRTWLDLVDPGTPLIALMPGVVVAMGDGVVNCACWVDVRIASGRVDEVQPQLEQIYRPYSFVAGPPNSPVEVTDAIRVEATTLWIATFVASVAALLVMAQVTARSASSMATSNDARRALGMDRGQRACGAALFLAPALVAGTVFGCALAYLMSGLFPRGLALRVEPEPGLRLDPAVLGLGGTGFLVVQALLVTVVGWRAAGVARPLAPKAVRFPRLTAGHPQRALGISFALDPVGGRRTAMVAFTTLVGATLASGGIVAVTTIQRSLDDARSDQAIYGAPTAYLFFDESSLGAPAAVEAAQGQPGITAITRTIALDDSILSATGPAGDQSVVEPTAFETLRGAALPTVNRGSMPAGDDEVALGVATARELGAGVDDTVTMADAGGSMRSFRVVGLVLSWDRNDPGHAVILTTDALLGLVCQGGVERGCNLQISVWADPADAAAADALTTAGFAPISPPANLDRLQEVGNIPWYLTGALGLLGAAGLAHALATALRHRRIDLAIGRALGWTPGQAAGVLVWQAGLTGLAGGLVGGALGLVTGRALWTVIARGLDIVIRPATPLGLAALTIAGVVAASLLLGIPAFLRAGSLSTTQMLRTE